MLKSFVLALVTAAAALGATSAHAGGVSWSIGINTPVIGTVISNAPVYYEPAYAPAYAPAPVYAPVYAPAPVYRAVPRVAYYPPALVYAPVPVVYPRFYPRVGAGWRHDRDHDGRWDRGHRDHDRRDDHGRR